MKAAVLALVVVIAVLGGFYGGYKVGQSNVSAATASHNNTGKTGAGNGGFTRNGGGTFGGGTACPSPGSSAAAAGAQAIARGRITSITATAMTINAGSCSVTIDFTNGTVVIKQVSGATSDLQDSQTVTVVGTRQADGSVKATTIAIGSGNNFTSGGGPGGGG